MLLLCQGYSTPRLCLLMGTKFSGFAFKDFSDLVKKLARDSKSSMKKINVSDLGISNPGISIHKINDPHLDLDPLRVLQWSAS